MQKILDLLCQVKVIFCIILFINISLAAYYMQQKQGFHSDEQWSYAHANSTQGAFLDKEINSHFIINDNIKERLFNRWIESKKFHNYLTVQKKDKFSYKNIYQNLSRDEHPPLYFILLHTICSFFPESFSKWYAGSLNIIAYILIYIVLFKLSKLLLKDNNLALITTVLWGFSAIGISTVLFLRMYLLQTLLYLCLTYETIKIISNNKATRKQMFLIGLYSFLGMYNQYNAIFFSFFITLVSCFIFYKRKNYKLLLQLSGVMLLSVIMLLIIYPNAYKVLFTSQRAKQVMSNLAQQQTSADFNIMEMLYYIDIRIAKFLEIIMEQFFILKHVNYQIVLFLAIIGIFLSCYFKIKISDATKWLIWVIFLYFIYLLAMPYMQIFHSRYYMSIMPFIAIMSVKGIKELLSIIHINKKSATTIIAILVIINSLYTDFINKSPYAFTYGQAEYQIKDELKGRAAFIDNGDMFIWLHSMVYYLANSKKVYITENICNNTTIEKIKETKEPIIFTYSSYIPGKYYPKSNFCLNKLGLYHKTTVCPSQHCYDVWSK